MTSFASVRWGVGGACHLPHPVWLGTLVPEEGCRGKGRRGGGEGLKGEGKGWKRVGGRRGGGGEGEGQEKGSGRIRRYEAEGVGRKGGGGEERRGTRSYAM